MTKANMIETIKENTAYAWYSLAKTEYELSLDYEPHCGYHHFVNTISTNMVYNRALGAWSELDNLCKELGINYNDKDWNDKAAELSSKVFQRVREV